MDCSLPGFSIHGIFQARVLKWVAILQGIFPTQGLNPGLSHCRQMLYPLSQMNIQHKTQLMIVRYLPEPSRLWGEQYYKGKGDSWQKKKWKSYRNLQNDTTPCEHYLLSTLENKPKWTSTSQPPGFSQGSIRDNPKSYRDSTTYVASHLQWFGDITFPTKGKSTLSLFSIHSQEFQLLIIFLLFLLKKEGWNSRVCTVYLQGQSVGTLGLKSLVLPGKTLIKF